MLDHGVEGDLLAFAGPAVLDLDDAVGQPAPDHQDRRYAKQLGQQEDQVQSEREHIKQLEAERNSANSDLTKLIEDLDLEATM